MDETEYNTITSSIIETIDAYYNYKASAYGVMEMIATDYSNLNFEVDDINNKLSNPENLSLLRDILTKMG